MTTTSISYRNHYPFSRRNDEQFKQATTHRNMNGRQSADVFCITTAACVGFPVFHCSVDRSEILISQASIDRALPRRTPNVLQVRILHLSQYFILSRPPGHRRMYDTLFCNYYWRHRAKDVYLLVENFTEWRRTRGNSRYPWHLRLFHASGPFDFVAMDILGTLQNKPSGNHLVIVMRDTIQSDDT